MPLIPQQEINGCSRESTGNAVDLPSMGFRAFPEMRFRIGNFRHSIVTARGSKLPAYSIPANKETSNSPSKARCCRNLRSTESPLI